MTTEITVVNDDIIHINKRLKSSDPEKFKDYVTSLEPQNVKWKVAEKDGNLVVETANVTATLNALGEISYKDKAGKLLLAECAEGTYIEPNSAEDNTLKQEFYAGDEALYGLGTFQNGLMNWKNTPVRLKQSNQEIAIPVLISTNDYGLYWHNYSITDFNYPDNEMPFDEANITRIKKGKFLIKKCKFTPSKSGEYCFFVDTRTEIAGKNRQFGEVLLKIGQDTVINYTTMWFPDGFSGKYTLEAGKEYDIEFHDTKAQVEGTLHYNEPDFNKTTFSNRHGQGINYFFIHGDNPQKVLSNYSKLTGTAPLFPKTSYGFWQYRENYPTANSLIESAAGYRKRGIPVDNVVLDWKFWPEEYWGPEWDRSRFPDPTDMVKQINDMDIEVMTTVWPRVQHPTLVERYGLTQIGGAGFVDVYNESIHDNFYRMVDDSMYVHNFQSVWLDGTEPANEPAATTPTAIAPYCEVDNIYALFVGQLMYDGHRKTHPDKRVVNMLRSAAAGQQRYGVFVWSGDVAATWQQLREQVTAGLNHTMTGYPYWASDIGAFFRDAKSANAIYDDQYTNPEYIELYTRWFEWGTFCPIFRIHGYRSDTEVWNYGKPFEDMARKFIDLRYQLMPYIYSTAKRTTDEGFAMMSPMAYLFPDERKLWESKDQFMFGKSMMICPVLEYKQRSREVYLPEGDWYDYWTNEKISGGKTINVEVALDEMPIYVRGGSILPIGPKVQSTVEVSSEPTILKIYGCQDATFSLYYDDDRSYDYETGGYSQIEVSYDAKSGKVTLESAHDEYINFAKNPMTFIVEFVGQEQKHPIAFDGNRVEL